MAVTWTAQITILDLNENRMRFCATRTDDVALTTHGPYCCEGIVTSAQDKRNMEDNVWSQYQTQLANEGSATIKIGNWLAEAKTNLEAKEPSSSNSSSSSSAG